MGYKGQPLELIATLFDNEKLKGPHDIEVADGYACVAGKYGTFTIVDIHDPYNPGIRGCSKEHMTECETVLLHEGMCFIGTHDFMAADISDPDAPRILSRVEDESIYAINGFEVWDSFVLAASKGGYPGGDINLFDISHREAPKLAGSRATSKRGELIAPHDITTAGDFVIAVDQRGGSPYKVGIYQGDKSVPPDNWELLSLTEGERLDGANRVIADPPLVYVASNKADTIAILNIQDPQNPKCLSVIDTAGSGPDGIELHGDLLFVGSQHRVEMLDVSEPTEPRWVSQAQYPDLFPQTGKGAHDLVCDGEYLYVTAQSENAIGIFKVL